jgi:hypothetical protein
MINKTVRFTPRKFPVAKRMSVISLFLCCLFMSSFSHAVTWVITYPGALYDGDERHKYPEALLKLALDKTGVRYEMRASTRLKYQSKALRQLKENIEVNVVWSMTDRQREDELLPIRIPLAKGLIGWRVLLSHTNKPFFKKKIDSLEDLLVYSPVQGIDWPDTKILQANGFNVIGAQNHTEALDLLSRQQVDFYPRSVIEALYELKQEGADPDIELKHGLALQYKTAMYFFVNKSNLTLARLIEVGLNRAIDDGSFDRLFYEYHGPILEQLDLDEVRSFELDNPLLPLKTPILEPKYWYTQGQYQAIKKATN